MKVKELIEELKKLDPDLEIEIEVEDARWCTAEFGLKVEEVWYDRPSNRYANIDIVASHL